MTCVGAKPTTNPHLPPPPEAGEKASSAGGGSTSASAAVSQFSWRHWQAGRRGRAARQADREVRVTYMTTDGRFANFGLCVVPASPLLPMLRGGCGCSS